MATTTRVLDAAVSGTVYTADANSALEALDTCHSGTTAPTDEVANGKLWLDTTTTPGILKMYDNATWNIVVNATNVTAAGAIMDSELTDITAIKALDQGVATTDSPTFTDVTATSLVVNGNNYPSAGPLSNRNVIVNGGMQVAQRGTSVTLTNTAKNFLADRFGVYQNSSTVVTMSQETDAPVGFSNSLKVAMGTGSTPSGANELNLAHPIEGYNTSSLALGTANAKEFTVSFWVKSSLTGNFGMALQSAVAADSFVTSYTIGSAGTWEYKTVTLTGKTSGTWNSTNGSGLRVIWDLGSSTNFEATKDTWGTGNKFTFSGATKVVATSSATWQIAGVQLELGDTATPFEHRSYGDELARCQRYYEHSQDGLTGSNGKFSAVASTGSLFLQGPEFRVTKRATPTMATYEPISEMDGSSSTLVDAGFEHVGLNNALRLRVTGTRTAAQIYRYHWSADAEL